MPFLFGYIGSRRDHALVRTLDCIDFVPTLRIGVGFGVGLAWCAMLQPDRFFPWAIIVTHPSHADRKLRHFVAMNNGLYH